jgi:diguanylate cyclase (GGDEF)-like protein/PAS domain S-box-containing protein
MMKIVMHILIGLLLCLSSSNSFSVQLQNPPKHEKVTLQLKWFHQFQFAGFYAAKEQGYYAEEGLDVDILERSTNKDLVKQVTSGEVDFAIGDSGISSYYARGEPIVALAAIFQHNPLVFIAKQNSGIISSYEMQGKKVMFDSVGAGDAPLRAILAETESNYTLIKENFNADDLINDKVDVMSAYLSNEPFYFKEKGVKINIINPQSYGFDFYGDILFTCQQQVSRHPERVEKFRRASIKGWQYALDHPEQLIQLIRKKYHSKQSLAHLRFEAEVTRKLMLSDAVPLGQLNARRFKKVSDVYAHFNFSRPLTENELANFIYTDQSLNLSEQEQAWLKAHTVIHVGIDKNFAPYEWINEQGEYVGLVADYLALFERKLGVKFKLIKDKTWVETLAMARNNQLDILSAVQETPERSQFLNFTLPYTSNSVIIINDKQSGFIGSLIGLNGQRVAIEKGYFMEEILKRDYPAISVLPVETSKEALIQVSTGNADAYVGDAAAAHFMRQTVELLNLQFSGTTAYSSAYSLAIVKTQPELASIMTKVIATIPATEHDRLKNHWMSIEVSNGINIKTLFNYALAVLLVVLFFAAWIVYLRHEIARRKTIEQQLRTLTIAIEQSPASVVITDLNANLQYVNPRFTEVTGYSAAEALGKNPRLLKSGLTAQETYKQLWNTLAQGEIWHGELINRRKNGTVYWEDVHIAPVKNSSGVITQYIAVKLDITPRKLLEEKLQFLFEASPLGFALNDLETGNFIDCNDAMFHGTGYNKAEFLALSYWDLTPQEYETQEQQQLESLQRTGRYGPYEKEYRRKDGSRYPVLLNGMLMRDMTGRNLIWSIVENITERKQIELALKKSNIELQQYFNQPFIGMLTASHQKKTITVNQCFCNMVGYSQAEMQTIDWGKITHPEDLAPNQRYLEQAIRGEIDSYQMEKRYIHKDGHIVYVDLAVNCVRLANGEPNYFIGMMQDITQRKAAEEEIKQLAFYDPLTGLPNRRKLLDRLQYAIALNHRTNSQFAVFMMDLDKFKAVNDSLGHAAGDELLKQVAVRITSCLRDSDMVARLGGDEFIFVLENLKTLEDAETIALKVIADLTIPFQLSESNSVQIGASIGISLYPQHGNTYEMLMDRADTALYQAKDKGRGCFAYFSDRIP